MHLQRLIDILEKENPDRVIPLGFNHPHSYRGYYDCLAFEFEKIVRIGDMLRYAKSALNNI